MFLSRLGENVFTIPVMRSAMNKRILSRRWLIWSVTIFFVLSNMLSNKMLIEVAVPAQVEEPAQRPQIYDITRATPDKTKLYEAIKARSLSKDSDAIFRFVADQVSYNVYAGVLRGARGTLWSCAGNSYDSSLLLASMLNEAGFQCRFINGSLDSSKARILVEDIFTRPVLTEDERLALIVQAGLQQSILEDFQPRAERDYKIIEDALSKAAIKFEPKTSEDIEQLVKIATDHVWVQVRQGDKWIDLDPSFRNAEAGQSFCKAERIWNQIPADKLHTVTIKVRLEEKIKGAVEISYPLTYKSPVFSLVGKNLMFFHEEKTGTEGLFNRSSGARSFTPLLYIDEEEISGKPISVQTGQGLGALFGGSDQEIVAEWIEFEFFDSLGSRNKVERALFDRVGYANRQVKSASDAKLSKFDYTCFYPVYNMAVVSSEIPFDFFLDTLLTETQLNYFQSLVSAVKVFNHLFTFYRTILPELYFKNDGVRSYINAPNLIITTVAEKENKKKDTILTISVDFASKSRLLVTTDRERIPAYERVFEGVLDFNVERMIVDQMVGLEDIVYTDGSIPASRNVGLVFELAEKDKILSEVINNQTTGRLDSMKLSPEAKARIKNAVLPDVAVVVPNRMLPGPSGQMVGWWKVDMATGWTEDEMDDGRHAAEKGQMEKDNAQKIGMVRRKQCAIRTGVSAAIALATIFLGVPAPGVGQMAKGGCRRPGPGGAQNRPPIRRPAEARPELPGYTTSPRPRSPFPNRNRVAEKTRELMNRGQVLPKSRPTPRFGRPR
jgi:hypothetical protein